MLSLFPPPPLFRDSDSEYGVKVINKNVDMQYWYFYRVLKTLYTITLH